MERYLLLYIMRCSSAAVRHGEMARRGILARVGQLEQVALSADVFLCVQRLSVNSNHQANICPPRHSPVEDSSHAIPRASISLLAGRTGRALSCV
jgi:hypothetical protein